MLRHFESAKVSFTAMKNVSSDHSMCEKLQRAQKLKVFSWSFACLREIAGKMAMENFFV